MSTQEEIYGLSSSDLEEIIFVIKHENKIESAYIFGSRAKGNYQTGSDVDIALKGSKLDHGIISQISFLLNEKTLMPYRFDVIDYNKIKNEDLRDHVDRIGSMFYSRE